MVVVLGWGGSFRFQRHPLTPTCLGPLTIRFGKPPLFLRGRNRSSQYSSPRGNQCRGPLPLKDLAHSGQKNFAPARMVRPLVTQYNASLGGEIERGPFRFLGLEAPSSALPTGSRSAVFPLASLAQSPFRLRYLITSGPLDSSQG